MIFKAITFGIIFLSAPAFASLGVVQCSDFLSSLQQLGHTFNGPHSRSDTQTFLALIKHLIKEKNALNSSALKQIEIQNKISDPMVFISSALKPEDIFAFKKAFSNLKDVKWDEVKSELQILIAEQEKREGKEGTAREETRNIFYPVSKQLIGKDTYYVTVNPFTDSTSTPFILAYKSLELVLINVSTKKEYHLAYEPEGISRITSPSTGDVYISFVETHRKPTLKILKVEPHGKPTVIGQRIFEITPSEIDNRLFISPSGSVGALTFAESNHGTLYSKMIPEEKILETYPAHSYYQFNGKFSTTHDFFMSTTGEPLYWEVDNAQNFLIKSFLDKRVLHKSKLPDGFDPDKINRVIQGLPDGSLALMRSDPYEAVELFNIKTANWLKYEVKHSGNYPLFRKTLDGHQYIIGQSGGTNSVSIADFAKPKTIYNFDFPGEAHLALTQFLPLKNGSAFYITAPLPYGKDRKIYIIEFQTMSAITINLDDETLKDFGGAIENADGSVDGYFKTDSGIQVVQLFGSVPGVHKP